MSRGSVHLRSKVIGAILNKTPGMTIPYGLHRPVLLVYTILHEIVINLSSAVKKIAKKNNYASKN